MEAFKPHPILKALAVASLLALASCQQLRHSPALSDLRAPDVFDVRLETILVEVHRDWSPHGADRFYTLTRSRYYDNAAFFRVIRGQWAQFGVAGNPRTSAQWRGQTIADDRRAVSNSRGTLAFAFAIPNGRATEPPRRDSASEILPVI